MNLRALAGQWTVVTATLAKDKTVQLGQELWRQRWMILLPLLFLLGRHYGWLDNASPITVALGKPMGAMLGFAVGMIAVQQGFGYITGGGTLKKALSEEDGATNAAVVWLGICILRGLILGAFVFGGAVGFAV